MTAKTSNESASENFALVAPELLSDPQAPGKIKPAAPASAQPPAFLYSRNLLTDDLRTDINKKWDACWPINKLRPLVLLDLISYLLFIKKLEEKHLIGGKGTDTSTNTLTHTKEQNELSWSTFKDMDPQSIHKLFTKEKGIPDLIKNYGHTNLQYSLFVKEPLLLTPTATELANTIDIIKIMEREDSSTRAAIFEYLLNKAEIVGQSGQVYAPDYLVKLVVGMLQPAPEDVIGDPAAGNGSFLVNSAMYLANKSSAAIQNGRNDAVAGVYKGIEADLIQLRIGAMNMILHGIEDPKLEGLNVLGRANLSLKEKPTLILSNLFFEGTEDKTTGEANTFHTDNRRKEICFLNLILKSLKSGGRAGLIIREIVLYDNLTEIKTIRQHIIDDHKLEAVISLPGKTGSLFSGACILIFAKTEPGTGDEVWFYKMKAGKHKKDADSIHTVKNDAPLYTEEYDEVLDILNLWKHEKEKMGRRSTGNSFYVPVDDIRANNYSLSFNEYRSTVKAAEPAARMETPVPDKEPIPVLLSQQQPEPEVTYTEPEVKLAAPVINKMPVRAQVATVKRKRLAVLVSVAVICIASLAFYFIYFKNKNNNTISATAKSAASPGKTTAEKPTDKPVNSTPAKPMLTPEQIKAILKDTTGILHFQNQVTLSPPAKVKGKLLAKSNANSVSGKKAEKLPVNAPTGNSVKVKYTVADTTFFHDQPNESTHRASYLDPLNKNILDPIEDRNGFIYIVYTNRFGRTSRGWINKKDLRPLQ